MEFTAATRTMGRVRGAGLSETATKYDYNMMKAGRCDFSNRNVLNVSEVTDSGCGTKMKYSKYDFQLMGLDLDTGQRRDLMLSPFIIYKL